MSDPSLDRDPFEVVAESFLARFRAGERPSVEEYAGRHPELAEVIRELLPALVLVERDLSIDGDVHSEVASSPGRSRGEEWRLGDYRIVREVGRGGMGVVYEAEQVSLSRQVALKVLPGRVASDRRALERFRREAKAAARLHHTNIVPVFEVGRDGDVTYYAMQFIEGQGLDQVIDELARLLDPGRGPGGSGGPGRPVPAPGRAAASLLSGRLATQGAGLYGDVPPFAATERLAPDADPAHPPTWAGPDRGNSDPDHGPGRPALDHAPAGSASLPGGTQVSTSQLSGRRAPFFRGVAQIGLQAAQGLAYAHANGIVHRDIKPSNLMLDHAGIVWITDFGLAKGEDQGLTLTGDILGTCRYMAPERFRGGGDARADIYALGLTLYELVTLRPGFDSTDRLELIERIKSQEPRKPRSVDARIPRDLETIVLKAIDKDPARRYQTAAAMAEDLQRFLDGRPIAARPATELERVWKWARRRPAVAGLVAALFLCLIAGTVVSTGFAIRADRERVVAQQQRARARAGETEATEQRERADRAAEVTRQNLYYAQMHLALQAWREPMGLPSMRELLANWLPAGKSPDRRGWEWFYINSLPYQDLRTLTDGTRLGRSCTVAWSVAGKRLAEGTSDGPIRIWDVDRERVTLTLKGPVPVVRWWGVGYLAWSPDGGKLAAGGKDATVHVWEAGSGREIHVLRGHGDSIVAVAFNSDGSRVAAWSFDGLIKIWDAATGRSIADVVHPNRVHCGAWSPDDRLLASGHDDGTVAFSGARAGDEVATLRGHSDSIFGLAWSPNGTRIASASMDLTARAWEVASRRAVLGPLRHNHAVTAVAWQPDGRRLATGSIDQTVKIWDATTGREAVTLRGQLSTITSLSWGPDGRLASGAYDGSMKVWDSTRDQEAIVLAGHPVRATSVAWSPDGQRLASGGDDGRIRIWDPAGRREDLALEGHDRRGVERTFGLIRSLAWSPDGRRLASAGLDHRAKVWEVDTGREVFALPSYGEAVWSVAWSPDGSRLACASGDGTIRAVEGLEGTPRVRAFPAHQGWARSLAWSPKGDRLASVGSDHLLKVWDPIRGVELVRMYDEFGSFLAVCWSPDGKRVASSGERLVIVWDAETGRKLATLRGHNDWVEGIAWSPDGERLASACNDGSVRVWDPRTGEEAFGLRGDPARFHDVSWTPDGVRLAAASSDGRIWIWDATRGFESDTTERALPYLERAVASGTARGEVRRSCAEFFIRAGKLPQAAALLKDHPEWVDALRPARQAAELVDTGVAAFQEGRFADAEVALRGAGERLQPLRSAWPRDPELARLHGNSLGFQGSTLRELKRPREALEPYRASVAAYESIDAPEAPDLYNLACGLAGASALDERASPDDRERLQARAVGCLRRAIESDPDRYRSFISQDRDLDPLRGRADYRDLMADAGFPRDPFARPSSPPPSAPGVRMLGD